MKNKVFLHLKKPVKGNNCSVLAGILVLSSCLFTAHAQTPPLQLRLESRTNALELTVSSLSATGALFIYQAADLQTLVDNPSLLFGTNTLSTNDVRVSLTPAIGLASQAFFSAANWPGLSTNDFADPEEYPFEPVPDKILFTSDLPPNLGDGSAFTVDFFVADPTGQPVAISGTATILVVRESDGAAHPDASITPSSAQMTNGYMRVAITVNSATPLDGYTLGLSIAPGVFGSSRPRVPSIFLKAVFGLGPAPLTPPQITDYTQKLEQRRLDNADSGPIWSYPLEGSGHVVSGTFGEWRGKKNLPREPTGHVHEGLDLSTAGVAAIEVRASRGGVISHRGNIPGMGEYLVIDHGTGWFSRYLHLDSAFISVKIGQGVTRGTTTLATRLYSPPGWGVHLHFEVRANQNVSQWENPQPGIGQDPLQTVGIFGVPPGINLPRLEEFGLTRQDPGQTAFLKCPPTISDNGPVYLFARFVDLEGGNRLGLRAMRFLPEAATLPQEIRSINETVINLLRPPGTGQTDGFAKYPANHFNGTIPQSQARMNYFRYWWQWDTTSYATDRRGPRSLALTGEDHGGTTATFNFTFGPQIKNGVLTPLSAQQYQFTIVAHLGANTIPEFVQPDQYKLEIIQANGQPLAGVTWTPTLLAGDYTRVFTVHLEEAVYTVTLPAGTTPDGLKLRVSSRLATNIAHETYLRGGPNMAFIPAGSFTMGDTFSDGYSDELPLHTINVSAFYMDKYEVTKALWDEVYQWAITHGYNFEYGAQGKAATHPAHSMTWYDGVKWCNARSEKEGRTPAYYTDAGLSVRYRSGQVAPYVNWNAGYRLPTEAEWERAARGGLSGQRFPWGDTISHSQQNYYSTNIYPYDISLTRGYHPTYSTGGQPYTSPVGSFAVNGYGLYDMTGNVWEWCWDWYGSYSSGSQTDPRGETSGSTRVRRGGGWINVARNSRAAHRSFYTPEDRIDYLGLRPVLSPGQ